VEVDHGENRNAEFIDNRLEHCFLHRATLAAIANLGRPAWSGSLSRIYDQNQPMAAAHPRTRQA